MKVTTVGIDLAKNVLQVHGVDGRGKTVLRKRLKRDQMAAFFANLPACLIGMEACGSAHHWARKLQSLGHTVKLMAPQFVKPYVKTNKNDVADAEAICEAVARPNMRFVPIKTAEQQSVLSLHRARQSFVKARTAQANQIRGLLGEYGVVIPQGIGCVAERLPQILEDGENGVPGQFRRLLERLGENLKEMDRQVDELEREIKTWHRESEASRKLEEIPGIGPILALTILAEAGDLRRFSHHRQFLKFCGLDLATEQSGQFRGLSRLSKRGNARLRAVFWMAASVAVRMRENSFRAKFERYMRSDPGNTDRKRKAYVAVAAKIARVAYALVRSGADYRCFPEVAVPSGRTRSAWAVEAIPTS